MSQNIEILIDKLNVFIKKYYLNKLIRGSIFYCIIFLSYFLLITTLENFAYFSIPVRTFLFYSFIILLTANSIWFVIIPLLRYFQLVKVMDYDKASQILASHFPELKDTIINSLELNSQLQEESGISQELILASIDQKIDNIKPIPFVSAVNFKLNFKYARYLGGIFAVLALLLIVYPQLISNGAERLVNHSDYYEKPAPFSFTLQNESLQVEKGKDVTIKLQLSGDYIPTEAYITTSGNYYYMKKLSNSTYEYSFRNIYNSFTFAFSADGYNSKGYDVSVLPSPQILSFSLSADVPQYTGIKSFISKNTGDISVPEGTKLKWDYKTESISDLRMTVNDSSVYNSVSDGAVYSLTYSVTESFKYSVSVKNDFIESNSQLNYSVNVIPDFHPEIEVISQTDSVNPFVYYFKGQISDDYGFSRLKFNYYPNDSKDSLVSMPIDFNRNISTQSFFYMFDFSDFNKGDKISYYFSVWDNDAVNGSKSARTSEYMVSILDDEELRKAEKESNSEIEENLAKGAELAKEIQEDIDKLKEKFLTESAPEWEKQNLLQDIKNKHDELQNLVEDIKEQHSDISKLNELVNKEDQELLEKQKQIEELLDNLMDEELQKLMDEFNQLTEEFNQKDFFKMSEDMKMSYDDLEEKLNRDLEMLKQYEVERSLEQTAEKLDELSKAQNELSEDIKSDKKDSENQSEQIDKQMEELDKIQEEYKEALEKNSDLENEMKLEDFEQDFQDIKQSLQESKEDLQKGNQKKSSKQQQEGSQKSKELSQKIQQQMAQNAQMQQGENMEDIRQLIDNILTFSIEQEELMDIISEISTSNPKYVELTNRQSQLIDNFENVKDSLYALAKRAPQISATVNKEVKDILMGTADALDNYENRRKSSGKYNQQVAITAANNLLLLMGEALDQMMQQQAQQMPGQQMCQNPSGKGGGKPSMQQMKAQQQSMKKQLQQMIDKMKKDGGNQKGGKSGMSKQISEMLRQQEMSRQMIQNMLQGESISPEATQKLKQIKQIMEQNERDLINRNISTELMNRQNKIMTRLLEAENAERSRDKDKKRKSEETKQQLYSNPQQIFQYKPEQKSFDDILKHSTIKLNQHYKKKYEKYLINISSK